MKKLATVIERLRKSASKEWDVANENEDSYEVVRAEGSLDAYDKVLELLKK